MFHSTPFEDPKQPKSKPFNWNIGEAIDFTMRLQFTESFNSALEEIRQNQTELFKWRHAARLISISTPGTDVSTPEKFVTAQVVRISEILNENDKLREQFERAHKIITNAFCAAGIKGEHTPDCAAMEKPYLPATHPARKPCNCWVGKAADFLMELARQIPSPPVVIQAEARKESKGPRHADYCEGVKNCTCFVRTMLLNGKLK